MFTVCPKCALTLVVTAADLRVAQGYVRCGRCSNVFNAIVGLSENNGQNTGQSGGQSSGTASTTIMRRAPSISDDPPHDGISDSGETEPVYAEPTYTDTIPPTQSAPKPASQKVTTPPAPAPKAPKPPEPTFTDSIPDVALEFNPAETDVTQVFIEAPPVNLELREITGRFRQLQQPQPPSPPPPPKQRPAPAPQRQAAPPPPPPPPPAPARQPAPKPETTGSQRALKPNGSAPPAPPKNSEVTVRAAAPRPDPANRPAASPRADASAKTGSRPALTPPPQAPAPAPAPQPPPKRANGGADVLLYRGAGDDSMAQARKQAAEAAKRRLAKPEPAPAPIDDEPAYFDENDEFDAPQSDAAGAFVAAAELRPGASARSKRMAWIGGVAALGVVLIAQAIHHNRHDLATNAALNRPLTRFYAAIGVPLVPRWNPALYEVRQLGAFSAAGDNGNLTVRASLKNDADQPLPLPILRITVQDRYGNRIATRDVDPKGYVPGALPDDAKLGVGQRIDAEMSFKDPGRDAVGFEIDACLPTPEGRISCANDAR